MENQPKPLFIFSLPRSGSTLCQRLLAAHKDVATLSESHLLLPYFYTLKERGVYSEYYHEFTAGGIQNFCQELPNGVDDYLAEIHDMVLRLYAKAAGEQVVYFVDKAGAYHLIVEDIIRLFAEGKFIFLWRNPLAVASSLMETWRGGKWNIYEHEIRLFQGVTQLVAAYEKFKDRVLALRYEDLVKDPDQTLKSIFAYLDLPFDPGVKTTFSQVQLKGRTGDYVGAGQYKKLSQDPLHKWIHIMANPLRKAWCQRYLKYIGRERLAIMGYDLDVLKAKVRTMPLTLNYLPSDILRMPYGAAFRLLEGRILKHKLQAMRAGKRVYVHR